MEYVKSEKGKDRLKYENYILYHDHTAPMADGTLKTYWRCSRYKDLKCHFRLHTIANAVVKTFLEHNHPANSALVEKEEKLQELREAAHSRESPHVIVSDLLANSSPPGAVSLPSKSSMKRTVQRRQEIRDEENQVIRLPNSREEIMPEKFCKTIAGESFLLYDSGPTEDRILVFGTKANLRRLARHNNWYMDGTFSSAPALFAQLYTIHYLEDRTAFPMVFALLPNRRQSTYEKLFAELKDLESTIQPETVMTDFELAAINGIVSSFPEILTFGCNFHFNQCLIRKVKRFGYTKDYNQEKSQFQMHIKMLAALAFVPVHKVFEAFDLISAKFDEKYEDLLNSFDNEWVGTRDRRGKITPGRFQIQLWNQYGKDIRTNNSVEGWNRSFNELMVKHNPSIWRFLNVLQVEQGKMKA